MHSDYIIKGGKSQYKIVITENNSDFCDFAAEEISGFLQKATGCKLPICRGLNSGIGADTNENNADSLKIELRVKNLNGEGFKIYSENKSYIVLGYSGKGVVFGAYALLNRLTGLTFYTPDCYSFGLNNGKSGALNATDYLDLPFKELNEERLPDIPLRAIGIAPLHGESSDGLLNKNALRMGVCTMADGWGISGHSFFKILPPEVYKAEHPDWYSVGDGGVNLCLTNEGMRKEFIEQVKKLLIAHPNDKYFMLGQPDTPTYCECPRCKAERAKFGGFGSMVMLNFTNSVVKEVNAWLKQNAQSAQNAQNAQNDKSTQSEQSAQNDKNVTPREVVFVMFAYQKNVMPPVQKTAEGYKPLFDIALEDNLAVMLAPLSARGDLSYFSKRNHVSMGICYYDGTSLTSRELFLGWRAVVKKLFVWSYCNDFADLFAPFNCFSALQNNYKGFKKMGAEYVFEEGSYLKYVPNFTHLRSYAVSKLMWDCNYPLKKAINEFFVGFYGEKAAKPLKNYFNYLQRRLKYISIVKKRPMLYVRFDDFSDLTAPEYWSFNALMRAKKLHEKAVLSAGENCDYRERVEEEGLPVWMILLLRYSNRLNCEERTSLANKALSIFKKYGYNGKEEAICGDYIEKIKKLID